jgi:hypothetical protein
MILQNRMIRGCCNVKLKDAVTYASNWTKDLSGTVSNTENLKNLNDAIKQSQDALNKTNWDILKAKLDASLWYAGENLSLRPNIAIAQLGKDLVELYEDKAITIPASDFVSNTKTYQLKLGSYENNKIEDVVSANTANILLKGACSMIEKVEYGPYQSDLGGNKGVSGRKITFVLKPFASILDELNNQAGDVTEAVITDEKLLKFAYDITIINTPETQAKITYDEFVKTIRGNLTREDVKLDKDAESFAQIKKSIQWNINYSVYVDRAFNPIGGEGKAEVGLTKDGIRELGKSAGFENGKPLNDAQVDLVCKLVCGGLIFSGTSFATPNTILPAKPSETISTEEWWKSVENNQGYKNLLKKWEDNFGKVVLPKELPPVGGTVEQGAPGGDVSSTQLACNGGSYEFGIDGSIKCLTEQPIDTNINPAQ